MKTIPVTENMFMVVLTPKEKAEINKKLKGLNKQRRLNAAIALQKAREIFITK